MICNRLMQRILLMRCLKMMNSREDNADLVLIMHLGI